MSDLLNAEPAEKGNARHGGWKLSADQKDAAVHLYRGGLSAAAVAKLCSVSRPAIISILKRRGEKIRDCKLDARSEALREGRLVYFGGKACPRGHICGRYVGRSQCVLCHQENSRHRDPERQRMLARARYQRSGELERENTRRWRAKNAEKMRLLRRVHENNRRARKTAAGGSHTADDVRALLEKQRGRCIYCPRNIRKCFVVDHITPVALGGRSDVGNIQLTCEGCNQRKHAKPPLSFARELGRLL